MTHQCDGTHVHSPEYMREFVLHPTILGVDPGVSTGICLAHYVGGKYRYITSTHTDVKSVWDLIDVPVEVVIIERFHAQVISKYGLHTVDLIGGIKALADRAGIRVIEDTPTQRKPYMTYARFIVPHNPSITRTEQRHEIDATAHVVRYLYNIGHITRLKVDDNG